MYLRPAKDCNCGTCTGGQRAPAGVYGGWKCACLCHQYPKDVKPAVAEEPIDKKFYLYVVQCSDDSLYAGFSVDPVRREAHHNSPNKGAKYTRARQPVVLLRYWECPSLGDALRAESNFKKMSRAAKLRMIADPDSKPK